MKLGPVTFAADEYDPYADIVEDDYADQIPAGWTPATPPAEPA